MKFTAVGTALTAALATLTIEATAETVPFNVGLAYPVSIYKTDNATVNTDLTLINSRIGNLVGLSAAGIASIVENDMTGYQVSTIVSSTGGDVRGFQASGIVSKANGMVNGYQVSGIVNLAPKGINGIQASNINVARADVSGAQMGLVNVAGDVRGFQLGFVNVSKHMYGVPFGIINIAENGDVQAIAFGSNFSGVNVGAKFIVNNFHSIIVGGTLDTDDDLENPISYGTFWGYHLPIGAAYLEFDVGSMVMAEIDTIDIHDPQTRQVQALRVTAGVDFTHYISLFAGVGAGVETRGDDWENAEFKPLFHAGITLF